MSEIIFGFHAVEALLRRQATAVQCLWILASRHPDKRMTGLLVLAKNSKIPVHEKSKDELESAAHGGVHQGVMAWLGSSTKVFSEADLPQLLAAHQTPLVLVLDGICDPHNLGACLRSAEAASVCAVIIPKDKAVGLTPTVHKISCGASQRIPVIAVTNLVRTLEQLKQLNCWLIGLAGDATESLYAQDLKGPLVMVMGAEEKGLRRLTRETCDYLAKIPMAAGVESLNVSVATGIVLFEVLRQRGAKTEA